MDTFPFRQSNAAASTWGRRRKVYHRPVRRRPVRFCTSPHPSPECCWKSRNHALLVVLCGSCTTLTGKTPLQLLFHDGACHRSEVTRFYGKGDVHSMWHRDPYAMLVYQVVVPMTLPIIMAKGKPTAGDT